MISEGTRQLDLYDFFSILVPGAFFAIALIPFLPEDITVSLPSLFIIVLIVGFIAGRGIHALSLLIDDAANATSHRDTFISELKEPEELSTNLVDVFYRDAIGTFPTLNLPLDREELSSDSPEESMGYDKEIEDLYGLVRGSIHIDARGRSRTFQAVFDFYRCMLVVSFLLLLVYSVYSATLYLNIPLKEWVDYTTYIRSLSYHPAIIFFGGIIIFGTPYVIFRMVRSKYRKYFIQYLVSDFILINDELRGR